MKPYTVMLYDPDASCWAPATTHGTHKQARGEAHRQSQQGNTVAVALTDWVEQRTGPIRILEEV